VRVTLANVGNPADGWVQVTAEPSATDGKADKAKAITTKTADFEFRLPSQQAEILGWNLKDVTSDKPEEQPMPAGLVPGVTIPGAPGMSPMRIPGIPGAGIQGLTPGAAPKPAPPSADAANPEAANTKSDAPAETAPAAAPTKEEPKDDGAKPSETAAPPAETKP
jgi:hypothetical protein